MQPNHTFYNLTFNKGYIHFLSTSMAHIQMYNIPTIYNYMPSEVQFIVNTENVL